MLREMVRAVCTEHSPVDVVRALEDDAEGLSGRALEAARRARAARLLIPEAYGGQGQSLLEAAIVYEEFGRALAPTPHFVRAVLSAGAILAAGQRRAEAGLAAGDRQRRARS